jgi:phenylacetate-coenzyme A ligase PaaK-like adenylate-forming protein
MNHLVQRIFQSNVTNFEDLCLEVFHFQYANNEVYKKYCQLVGINENKFPTSISQIPFLPIDLFKTHAVKSFTQEPEKIFFSSATGGKGQSQHLVQTISIYETSFTSAFENYFGPIQQTCFLGLLPSYLEREGSSLIYMVQKLMKISGHPLNGFFLYEHEALKERILQLEKKEQPYYLFGVSFAILDFASKFSLPMKYGKIIETGGMKGRKKEITRHQLNQELNQAFSENAIYSEYGMTELMSQAYAKGEGFYESPPWLKIQIVDPNDPFTEKPIGQSGLIRVIDLANLYSCSFIQTSDLGSAKVDGSFEVLGRIDYSDLRGCSLMVG